MTPSAMLALWFAAPLMLIGLLAAAIPIVLHLISSVRARDMVFPTLRFLRLSMEKTARKRRVQHWLLLALRAAMLALLALAVAEPISRAAGGWLAGQGHAAAIILDNSYSMGAPARGGASRLEQAKAQAATLLSGDDRPVMAAVLTTAGGSAPKSLSAGLDDLRERVNKTHLGYGPANLERQFAAALDLLAEDNAPRKAIYIFSDMQRTSFERVAALKEIAEGKDVHVLVVDVSQARPGNVGITDLQIRGRRVVDAVAEFTATLTNSSPTDKTVDAVFRVDGGGPELRVRKTLRPAGREGSVANVRFHHRFGRAGLTTGRVVIETADDLPADNVRLFSLNVGDRVRATLVRAESDLGGPVSSSGMLNLALDPFGRADATWPIRTRVVEAPQFGASDLAGADIVFLADLPRVTAGQAKALERFARTGGTVAIFLGPSVDAAAYNDSLVQRIAAEGGLLPGRIEAAVGDVGPAAPSVAVASVDIEHAFFRGLYDTPGDYLTTQVQRYYRLSPSPNAGRCVVRLANGDPLVIVKDFGAGRVVLCTTSGAPRWSNLPISGLFLPMVARMSLAARREQREDPMYLAGSAVPIRPRFDEASPPKKDEKLFVNVMVPAEIGQTARMRTLPLSRTAQGFAATFGGAEQVGLYRWKVSREAGGAAPEGAFAVNPYGPESRVEPMKADEFVGAMKARRFERVYVAGSLEEASALAAAGSRGRNWWDLMLAATILVFVVEAVIANRREEVSDMETRRRGDTETRRYRE